MFEDTIDAIEELTFNALGTESPEDQIVASSIIGAAVIATSAVGLVGTLLLLPIPAVLLVIGVVRLIPAADSLWPLS